jgi:hypothetical protein
MKRTRKKHNAGIKRRGGSGGGQGDRTIAELASGFGVHPNGIYTGRSSCWTGRRAFWKAAVARAHVGKEESRKALPFWGTERRYGAGGEEWQLRRCN